MNIGFTLVQLVEWSLYVGLSCAICAALYESRHAKIDPKQPLQVIADLPQSFFYALVRSNMAISVILKNQKISINHLPSIPALRFSATVY